ncbi:MAG: prephenate dehydrogenase [Oscillospiraceae bacterium]|nr:prephenate dehydrogenase [Oscillospiraceae bacterium]MBQ2862536.1 prephenate dehydrogenase [Oscillospiraceae bacterium]
MLDTSKNILIVGLGLIGGSYAKALRKLGFKISAITLKQEDIDYAIENGIIDEGYTEPVPEVIGKAELIIFALYPKTFKNWIDKYQQFFKPGALLTDVTGVKSSVVYDIQNMLRPDVEFIAAHPMAGKEVYGVQNSDPKIFHGANYIVTPTEKNSKEAVEDCLELGRLMGFNHVSVLTPEKHDEMIGFVSQLTHCIAVSLMNCYDGEKLQDYTGDSFRDLTRIARINDEMWSELFLLNKETLLEQMDKFLAEFSKLRQTLEEGDRDTMREMMRISTARRALFDKK